MSFTDPVHARLWLMRTATPPARHLADFVAGVGAPQAVARLRSGQPGSAPDAVLAEAGIRFADITDDLNTLATGSAQLLIPEADGWPSSTIGDLVRHDLAVA